MKEKDENENSISSRVPFGALVSRKAPAKELAKCCKIGEGNTLNPGYVFSEEEFEYFCSKLLDEQREICAEKSDIIISEMVSGSRLITPKVVKKEIKNVKRPKL